MAPPRRSLCWPTQEWRSGYLLDGGCRDGRVVDLEDYASKIIVPYGAETEVAVAEVSEHPYRRLADGGPALIDKVISVGTDDATDPQVQADAALETRRDAAPRGHRAGYSCYDLGLIASGRLLLVVVRAADDHGHRQPGAVSVGQACYPQLIRLMGMTWASQRSVMVCICARPALGEAFGRTSHRVCGVGDRECPAIGAAPPVRLRVSPLV